MGFGKGKDLAGLPVINTFELLSAADRPVDGIGTDAEFIFQLLHQLIWITGFSVHLIDESKNRDMPHGTYLEKLARLRFDTLCSIEHHYGRICRHKRPVGVLRKVLMAGSVEDVDAVTFIFKLEHGACDGDSSLFFKIHPVRHGMSACSLAFDRSGSLNGSAIKQKLFRQGCFTGVRMRNNGKCSSSLDFFSQVRHNILSKNSLTALSYHFAADVSIA